MVMLNVLIVEDESWMRRGIRSMLQSSAEEIAELDEAENADEALERIRAKAYDILFVDIRMPGMNGLTFIETASALLPSAEFILVSGYHEFEYTKRAIRLRVSDYLLKPIVKDELLGAFHKAAEQAKRRRHSAEPLGVRQAEIENVLHEKLMLELIEGREDAAIRLSRSLQTDFAQCLFACVSFRVQHSASIIKENGKSEIAFIYYTMMNVMDELLGEGLKGIMFQRRGCLHAVLYRPGSDQAAMRQQTHEFIGRVLQWVRRLKFFQVRCGISGIHEQSSGLRRSLREAECALACSIFAPDALRTEYDPSMEQEGHVGYSFELEKELYHQVLTGSEAGIGRAVAQIVDKAFAQVRTVHALRQLLDMCWLLGERWLIESAEPAALPISYGEFATDPLYYDDLEHLRRELTNHFGMIGMALARTTVTDGKKAVGDMVEYIRNHYNEDISLTQLAEKLYMNPAYLSELFKETTGMGFVAYVTSVRMEKACEFLRHRDLKIHQIASLVGYEDERYFSTVFRKYHGLTPSEYRKKPEVLA